MIAIRYIIVLFIIYVSTSCKDNSNSTVKTESKNLAPIIYSTGILDKSFNSIGKLVLPTIGEITSLTIQTDGKILVVGSANDIVIARINSDGSMDNRFGVNGVKYLGYGAGAYARGIEIQSDGKILVAGTFNHKFAISKLLPNGNFDSTFLSNGKALIDVGGISSCESLALLADGKIILGGRVDIGASTGDFVVVKINSDGTFDQNFGTGGIVTTDFNGTQDWIRSIAVYSDESIIAVGSSDIGGTVLAIAKYQNDGMLDSSFGNNGTLTFDNGNSSYAEAVILQTDGKILVAGPSATNDNRFQLGRLESNGTLDLTFNGGGVISTNTGYSFASVSSLAIQGDGKIIAAGYVYSSTSKNNFAVIRYNHDGTLDETFGTQGIIVTDFYQGNDSINAIKIQKDGNLIVGGHSALNSNYNFAIARYGK